MRQSPIACLTSFFRVLGLLLLGLRVALAAAEPDAPHFDVWEFAISGNTLLGTKQIEKTVYPFLGPSRSVADVEQARRALERAYRDAGFGTVVVTIPEQDVEQGVVRLEVLQGTVDRLLVSGSSYFSPLQIRDAVPALTPGSVPDLAQVQAEVAALNAASADRRITPVLRPGREPGTVEAELKVDDRLPVHGSLEYNNEYTRDTSRTRATATLSYDNLWQRQHSVSLGYQTAPEERDDVTVLFGTYTARLSDSPWLVSGYLVDSDTAVSSVGTLGVLGAGQIAGLRFIRPLPPLGNAQQRAVFGIDYKDFDESVALSGGASTIETPVQYGTISAGWALNVRGEGSSSEFSVTGMFGPRFLGNDTEEFANKRAGASPNFAYLALGASHEHELPGDTRLRLALRGQLAGAPLISNEQFSIGGASSVRGYLESQAFFDDGLNAQMEFSSPDWGRRLPGVDTGRLHAFVDAGIGRLQDPLPEQDDEALLWSAGIGLRARFWRHLTQEIEWAWPLRDSEDGSIESGDDRWHFSVQWAF